MRTFWYCILAILSAGIIGSSGLIDDPYHPGRAAVEFATMPELNAPLWLSRWAKKFRREHNRPPTEGEAERLAVEEFTGDVARMKLTWLTEVHWRAGEQRGEASRLDNAP